MENDRVQKLLLAAKVREVAAELRKDAARVAWKAAPMTPVNTLDLFQPRYFAEHPVSEFTEQAIKELSSIADSL